MTMLSLSGATIPASPPDSASANVTDAEVAAALQKAADFLRATQRYSGIWSADPEHRTLYDTTTLAAFAQLEAGVPLSDPRLQRAIIPMFDRSEIHTVFARAHILLLWNRIDPARFRKHMEDDVRYLRIQQSDAGAWGFGSLASVGPGEKWLDNEHTQLAIHALLAAQYHGIDAGDRLWQRSEQNWLNAQNEDGGWGFPRTTDPDMPAIPGDSYGSMTAAALASLNLVYDARHLDEALPFNGRFKARCGEDSKQTRDLRDSRNRGWQWWKKHFRTDSVPGLKQPSGSSEPRPPVLEVGESERQGSVRADPQTSEPRTSVRADARTPSTHALRNTTLPFYLYQAARLGRLSGKKRFADREWYPALARQLLDNQKPEGAWGGAIETSYAMLALAEGRTPILINELEWDNTTLLDPRDAINLLRWYRDTHGVRAAWQTINLAAHPADLCHAPILYITGHDAPALDADQRQALQRFVHAGGTLMGVACCSRNAFAKGTRDLFDSILPDHKAGPLPEDHPFWHIGQPIEPNEDIIAFRDGCRLTAVIFPGAACCAWQQNLRDRYGHKFRQAGNLLRYATWQRNPVSGLEPFVLAPRKPGKTLLTAARWKHGGDWNTDPLSLEQLSVVIGQHTSAGIDVRPAVSAANLTETPPDLLWITGHTFTPPTPTDAAALRAYLKSGGTVVATACCGRKEFDDAFRPWVTNLLGPKTWNALPADHPVITGEASDNATPLHDMTMRTRVDAPPPAAMSRPLLLGARHDERWAVFYSPYDINCGVTGHNCPTCVGYTPDHARAIAKNLLLYTANHKPTDP